MLLWEKEIPAYLTDRKNVIGFILFTAVFALVFINMYEPFDSGRWLNVTTQFQFFFYSSLIILIGVLVIVFSRLLMFLIKRHRSIRYGVYALWIVGEIFSMALVYAIIQEFYLQVEHDFMIILRNSVRNTALVILLPYIISWLYLSFKDKYQTLEELTMKKEAQTNKTVYDKNKTGTFALLHFKDEKGSLKFSIKNEDLIYLEAADNYIIVHYLDNQKEARYILRNTLKNIEQEFRNSNLVRSHRSFIVNMDKVKMIKKEKEGLVVGFDVPFDTGIPISKTYVDSFIKKLSISSDMDA